jgi:hypothetical protein
LTERRTLVAALAATPVFGAVAMIDDGETGLLAAIIFVAAWSVYAAIFVGVARLDLRRAGSRGRIAFGITSAAFIFALLLLWLGSPVVLPGLALILVAASLRGARARLIAGWVLVVAATAFLVALVV